MSETTTWKPGQKKDNPKLHSSTFRYDGRVKKKLERLLKSKQNKHGDTYKMSDLFADLVTFSNDNIFF